jgi:hypothetical protein
MFPTFRGGVVACLPFTDEQLNPKKETNLAVLGPKGKRLLKLCAWAPAKLEDSRVLDKGELVIVRSDVTSYLWAKDKYQTDEGVEIILVPLTEVLGVAYPEGG